MKNPESIHPHPGPPDDDGWWLVSVPGRDPYLICYDTEDPPQIEKFWQRGYHCWKLDVLSETPHLERLLTSLLSKPNTFHKLAVAMNHLLLAGPWRKSEDGSSWIRSDTRGKTVAMTFWDGTQWFCKALKTEFHTDSGADDVEAAQAEVDKRLHWMGYFLLDPS